MGAGQNEKKASDLKKEETKFLRVCFLLFGQSLQAFKIHVKLTDKICCGLTYSVLGERFS